MGDPTTQIRLPNAELPTVFDDARELCDLPRDCEVWPLAAPHSGAGTNRALHDVIASLKAAQAHGGWQWPDRPVVFLSDTHADFSGFLRSLVAAGVVRRTGHGPRDFRLTAFGESAQIVIGGDCLDKGPSNFDMLDALSTLMARSDRVHLLAGNHDLRLRLAIRALAGPRCTLTEHLFLRMGRKILPLLREVRDRFPTVAPLDEDVPDEATCRRLLLPRDTWFEDFPVQARAYLSEKAIRRESGRLRAKLADFDLDVAAAGLTMREVHAAARRCEVLFLIAGGPYRWFYRRMEAVCRNGSLLFAHAGIDDEVCATLAEGGAAAVNQRYRRESDLHPLAFYFGSVANLARTKYRKSDKQLSNAGVRRIHRVGIKMIVHGHVNNLAGQRLLARSGLLHLQGDVTLDCASRRRAGLKGIGAGATLVFPSGDVFGLSSDYPRAKHFNPSMYRLEAEPA